MRIRRLEAKNFRALRDFTIDFPDEAVIVLAGENGSGKSSILDCLAIMMTLLAKILAEDLPRSGDLPRHWDEQKKEKFIAKLREMQSTGFQHQLVQGAEVHPSDVAEGTSSGALIVTATYKGEEAAWPLSFTLGPAREIESTVSLSELYPLARPIVEQLCSETDAALPPLVYYPVDRYVGDLSGLWGQEGFPTEPVAVYFEALKPARLEFQEFFTWFRYREDLENERRVEDSKYRDQQMNAVRQSVQSMIRGFSDLRVRRNPPRMVVTKRFPEEGEALELEITQLSGGEKGLITMVADLARRLAMANPNHPEPLKGEGLVLIDEIELHLHPAWQRSIIPTLTKTFPNCQFIVATHSPQVISELRTESLFLLRQSPSGITAEGPLKCFGRDSNRILEDLLGVSERPEDIKEDLLQYFRYIDSGEMTKAKQLRAKLEKEIGADEPEFVKADVLTRAKEMLAE
ncbi:MAG: ATP-binding protein [Deltaproteobacteria bacterium]|nr:ATP-binding protein [Deltaproteobacteria bacterium]